MPSTMGLRPVAVTTTKNNNADEKCLSSLQTFSDSKECILWYVSIQTFITVLKIIYLDDAKCSEGSYIHLLLSIDSVNLGVFPSHMAY